MNPGIEFATALILFLVPCLYLVLEDMKAFFGVRRSAGATG